MSFRSVSEVQRNNVRSGRLSIITKLCRLDGGIFQNPAAGKGEERDRARRRGASKRTVQKLDTKNGLPKAKNPACSKNHTTHFFRRAKNGGVFEGFLGSETRFFTEIAKNQHFTEQKSSKIALFGIDLACKRAWGGCGAAEGRKKAAGHANTTRDWGKNWPKCFKIKAPGAILGLKKGQIGV